MIPNHVKGERRRSLDVPAQHKREMRTFINLKLQQLDQLEERWFPHIRDLHKLYSDLRAEYAPVQEKVVHGSRYGKRFTPEAKRIAHDRQTRHQGGWPRMGQRKAAKNFKSSGGKKEG